MNVDTNSASGGVPVDLLVIVAVALPALKALQIMISIVTSAQSALFIARLVAAVRTLDGVAFPMRVTPAMGGRIVRRVLLAPMLAMFSAGMCANAAYAFAAAFQVSFKAHPAALVLAALGVVCLFVSQRYALSMRAVWCGPLRERRSGRMRAHR